VGVTAYAIVDRVPNAAPRLRLVDLDVRPDGAPDLASATLEAASLPQLETEDDESLADRIAAVRTAFAQTTWYLFSPDGWR
jgi:hypothetical protein